MTRRSSPQRRIDDEAFPVRVKLWVPEGGFGRQLTDLHAWLDREAGRGDYAFHAASTLGISKDAVAIYFKTPETAHRFVGSFPDLLADGTDSMVYSSPYLPNGRPQDEKFPVCNLLSDCRAAVKSTLSIRRTYDKWLSSFQAASERDRHGGRSPRAACSADRRRCGDVSQRPVRTASRRAAR